MEVCKRNGEATFAGMGGKEEDAPVPGIRRAEIEPRSLTESGHALSIFSR
jgi:hypothetical protein